MIKRFGKAFLCLLFERQVKKLRQRNQFKIIAVAGSVGKTSTKLAIAHVLKGQLRTISQDGNYNDRLTVPLVLFGHTEPGIFNVFAWIGIWLSNYKQLKRPYPYDVAVLELGTDAPGQIAEFAYLKPDLVVVTAVAAEHMEYFGTIQSVADEELTVIKYSQQALLNIDDIDDAYLPSNQYLSYGNNSKADYRLVKRAQSQQLAGQQLDITLPDDQRVEVVTNLLGNQGAKAIVAAVAVADVLKLEKDQTKQSVATIRPVAGRMQILPGIKESLIIDDTYNASPVAVKAALDVLYSTDASQRIAIIGSMNELGESSANEHADIGQYCDPKNIDLVVTIGAEAKTHLAPAATNAGNEVVSFLSPHEAGLYVKSKLQTGAVILAKGSQNGVFAEESLKSLLANEADWQKLVRQSDYWLKVKAGQFPEPARSSADLTS